MRNPSAAASSGAAFLAALAVLAAPAGPAAAENGFQLPSLMTMATRLLASAEDKSEARDGGSDEEDAPEAGKEANSEAGTEAAESAETAETDGEEPAKRMAEPAPARPAPLPTPPLAAARPAPIPPPAVAAKPSGWFTSPAPARPASTPPASASPAPASPASPASASPAAAAAAPPAPSSTPALATPPAKAEASADNGAMGARSSAAGAAVTTTVYSQRGKQNTAQPQDGEAPHPLAVANPDHMVVVCEAGCDGKPGQVVLFKPIQRLEETSEMVPTSGGLPEPSETACVAGCDRPSPPFTAAPIERPALAAAVAAPPASATPVSPGSAAGGQAATKSKPAVVGTDWFTRINKVD